MRYVRAVAKWVLIVLAMVVLFLFRYTNFFF